MTTPISGSQLAERLAQAFPQLSFEHDRDAVYIPSPAVGEVARFLKETPGLDFDYLAGLTAVDYLDYFEVVYHLTSMQHNHSAVLKTRLWGRTELVVPSVTDVWKGADFQEREVYDLLGVVFQGHPNLKRILTWEGFPGHPLRKDFLEFDHRKVTLPDE